MSRGAGRAVCDHLGPYEIAVAADHCVSAAVLARFVRIQRRMNAPEHHERPALASGAADFVAAVGVGRVDPDADNVAVLNL